MKNTLEAIVCSAILYENGAESNVDNLTKGSVICGKRHGDCYATFKSILGDHFDISELAPYEKEGFLTSHNRFVEREEAAKIAFAAGQINKPIKTLHSEDLY